MKKMIRIILMSLILVPTVDAMGGLRRRIREESEVREPRCLDCMLLCFACTIQETPRVASGLWQRAKQGVNSLRSHRPRRPEYYRMSNMNSSTSTSSSFNPTGSSNYKWYEELTKDQ